MPSWQKSELSNPRIEWEEIEVCGQGDSVE